MLTEKELNIHLLDQLDLLERLEMADSEIRYMGVGGKIEL